MGKFPHLEDGDQHSPNSVFFFLKIKWDKALSTHLVTENSVCRPYNVTCSLACDTSTVFILLRLIGCPLCAEQVRAAQAVP